MSDWTSEYDVVVVGSGGGALTGAYAAAARGARTAVLEKTSRLGGTSAYSGGALWLPGTSVQERAAAGDSTDAARTYLRAVIGDSELERQEAFVSTAQSVVDLLEGDPNIELEWRPFPDYYARPGRQDVGRAIHAVDLDSDRIGARRIDVRPELHVDRAGYEHPDETLTGGRALIGRLTMALDGTGHADIRLGTAVTALIMEDGRVVGVEAHHDGVTHRIKATRGVLLAAGGIEGNASLRGEAGTPGRAAWSMGPRGANTGDLLCAAREVGAATALLNEAWWCPGVALPDGSAAFMVGVRAGMLVDATGERYLNESLPYDQFGRAMLERDSVVSAVPSYLIFDSRDGAPILPAISIPDVPASDHLDAGTWVQSNTLEALAGEIGVSADTLVSSVARFNDGAKRGVDEDFARGEDPYDRFFCPPGGPDQPNPALRQIDTAPFYAARIVTSDLGTKGGVTTDADARVQSVAGHAISGLYAAGNTAASLSGSYYPGPGVPLGTAMVFAYRAVCHMLG
ncbi:3-oxosteroid 1-dehydrogenase [Rhodococcus fascians]|uniref:FAD-dependent oxidoreductase n=1 Tax=Nocardiaceae TaxID=85025 RepID=UPI0028543B0F|nr:MULTISPECIES: FAD-dependent oxidoreductase [Rhodococcus]MDR6910728.1 3-oxosteroid 1-dehydrogenase [Rhodococcus sp. 3258]MDR6931905.1 3-oxosteroid 1-dehydrogenase [Rhodococcus fascians]